MADKYSKAKSRGMNLNALKNIVIAVLLILLIAGIGASIFFKVTVIEVSGESEYSNEEIIKISGIEYGDSLLLVRESKAAMELCGKLPLIKSVKIVRSIPNKIKIEVTENKPVAYMKIDQNYWTIDSSCKLLKRLDLVPAGMITVTGVTPISPAEGEKLSFGEAGTTTLSYLEELLTAIETEGEQENVDEISMSNVSNIAFKYLGRFAVYFGRGDNAKDKLRLLSRAVENLGAAETGTIDVSSGSEARFVPSQVGN